MRLRILFGLSSIVALAAACGRWDPSRPFERESPQVNLAISALDAGDAMAAAKVLEEYLSTGECNDGNIGLPDLVRRRPDGTFDLGLALFQIGESFGGRFGEEEADAGDPTARAARRAQVDCALRLVKAIASDPDVPLPLRAQARYLEGNLNFLDGAYEDAVRAYDEGLALEPAQGDAGDPVARDMAWNRAIALRRIEEKKDAGPDGGEDASPEAGSPDAGQDASKDAGEDTNDAGSEGEPDAGGGEDGGGDGGNADPGPQDGGGEDAGDDAGAQPNEPDAGPEPPPRANQDDRILDMLENAPTVQQEAAKRQAGKRHVRGMIDK